MTPRSDILMYQTALGEPYEGMLRASAAHHAAYCARFGIDYRPVVGLRRGFHPWQASFNRIEALHDLLQADWQGWFVYLDADAVVCQPTFDLPTYLGKRAHHALIAAPATDTGDAWNINNGVFFLNLSHPHGRAIAAEWHLRSHVLIDDVMLKEAVLPWQARAGGLPFPDDQHLLQVTLLNDTALQADVLVERGGLINGANGRFIRQFMRHLASDAERLALIERMVGLFDRA